MMSESNSGFDIDFILTWVDGDDVAWKKKYANYKGVVMDEDVRYRDMGLLKYWFRLVEAHAPWVRKIFFVTEGHVPEWMNLNHPKLVHVCHADYIPAEHLPVFSSHPIEVNFHRIEGLSENFVYFNDDMFIFRDTSPDLFFDKSGLPRDAAVMNAISGDKLAHTVMNDVAVINDFFSKKDVMRKNFCKWFNVKYGSGFFRNLLLLPWPNFTGFYDYHLPAPYLKRTFYAVWEAIGCELEKTSSSKFRDSNDLNQYVFRYWQLASGDFTPIDRQSIGFYTEISNDNSGIRNLVLSGKYNLGCINDSAALDFESAKGELLAVFNELAPEKSSFEV